MRVLPALEDPDGVGMPWACEGEGAVERHRGGPPVVDAAGEGLPARSADTGGAVGARPGGGRPTRRGGRSWAPPARASALWADPSVHTRRGASPVRAVPGADAEVAGHDRRTGVGDRGGREHDEGLAPGPRAMAGSAAAARRSGEEEHRRPARTNAATAAMNRSGMVLHRVPSRVEELALSAAGRRSAQTRFD